MSDKKRRRLFNIKTEEVSLVDIPANQKKFLVVKNQEGNVDPLEALKPILAKIEKALNDIFANQDALSKRLDALEPNPEELKKAGKVLSKDNLTKVKAVYDILAGMLAGAETELTQKNQTTEKEPTAEETAAALRKGIESGMKTEQKSDTNMTDTIAKAIAEALKNIGTK